mmetsp:Transcript_8865/g.33478  ORF Transcript_8865/g.33478 Transcript_8865/m.33478 type:complete len:269 (-) Transcript_8865:155-961(-)
MDPGEPAAHGEQQAQPQADPEGVGVGAGTAAAEGHPLGRDAGQDQGTRQGRVACGARREVSREALRIGRSSACRRAWTWRSLACSPKRESSGVRAGATRVIPPSRMLSFLEVASVSSQLSLECAGAKEHGGRRLEAACLSEDSLEDAMTFSQPQKTVECQKRSLLFFFGFGFRGYRLRSDVQKVSFTSRGFSPELTSKRRNGKTVSQPIPRHLGVKTFVQTRATCALPPRLSHSSMTKISSSSLLSKVWSKDSKLAAGAATFSGLRSA